MASKAGNPYLSRALLPLTVAVLIACLLGFAALARPAEAAIDPISTKAIGSIPTGTTLHWYRVRTTGTVAGSVQYDRTGWLVVASPAITRSGTSNGVNPVDLFLITGNPGTNPEAGAIEWATNSTLHDLAHGSSTSSRARLDTSSMGCTGTNLANLQCNIAIDQQNSLSDLQNNFNTSSGVLGDIYRVYSGRMALRFVNSNGTLRVAGQTDTWLGRGALYGWGRYNATINGTYFKTTRA